MSQAAPLREDIHPIFQTTNASPNRLVHLIPDELASAVPDHPLFAYPKTAKPQDGFVDVSCKTFADAVNRVSWYLRYLLGPPKNFETIGYMGPSDIRYFLFMFGAIKVGYKMVFVSPRNNVEAHVNVLAGVDCHVFLRAKETNIDAILKERPMLSWVVPELEEFLMDYPVAIYPYNKSFEEAWSDPCLVLHTTGSTGLPKPITWNVGILSTYEAWRTIPEVDGYVPTTEVYQQSRRAYTSMPLFHTSGLNAGITWAMLLGVTLVYGAPQVIPNAIYADEMHQYANVDASMGAPSIYEELCRNPEALERINRLHYVVASGAPLSHKAGDLISKHTRVICNLGATETACLQRLSPSIDDWPYFHWHPTHSGIQMREALDGLYELFIVRDPNLKLYQGVFNTFPDIEEWSMRDLYSRHPDPSKPFLYMYQCRKDDVIVLSNGEKIAPALIEATLMSHPLVKGAMVVGQGRFQPAVLIDLLCDVPRDSTEKYQLLESMKPTIAEANTHAPGHGKLDQYHILFADSSKPIKYLGQGKIQRKSTFHLYEQDIEELYKTADEAVEHSEFLNLPTLELNNPATVASWLQQLIKEITDLGPLQPDTDLFAAGIDSLQVIQMARELRFQARELGMGEKSAQMFPPASVYTHPTVDQLTSHILDQLSVTPSSGDHSIATNGSHADESFPLAQMHRLFQKYCDNLPQSSGRLPPPPSKNMVVLLTGSTGSLGSYLLDELQRDENVSHIICLNRSADAAHRHTQLGFQRGLSSVEFGRVEFLQADLSQPKFGLEDAAYSRLLQTVTHVIHNQWAVNFNWKLASFEPFIRGVRHLIDFSHASAMHSFITFISSVSAVGSWDSPHPVPEGPIHDFSVAAKMGYGQSKLISECLLDKAAEVSGVQSACCRVGIVAGPIEQPLGLWNPNEYIPSIFISSVYLNAFPVTFPSRDRLDWIPVDKLSKVLLEILRYSTESNETQLPSGTHVYHVINPSWTSWSEIAPEVLACYPDKLDIQPVSFENWVEDLKKAVETTTTDPKANPAAKLLDFFKNAVHESAEARMLPPIRAQEASSLLRRVGCVNTLWISNWMRQWGIISGGSSESSFPSEDSLGSGSSSGFLPLN
ncbi:non-ribosomal peptide synthetase [Aspergillus affinis]|uniref:non-ribosomal peptide synthetase n=1 Tax=Aspergillus affinis TaxID=1070780 RepID=UPI0022FDD72C|nr:L-aminoadipate-semialdehyde dehydrogenase [Aspergillus affinis]KAI9042659.1 L-aminoadipate-semialdehyde dehydrogenase [Aspergillus affinis]